MTQFKYIDGLRGLAILGVIMVHTSQYGISIYTNGISLYPGFINRIFEQGARGVQLFYVVSAFTLFLSFYGSSNFFSAFSIRNFFIRRVFRVLPLYWLAILYFGFIAPQFIFHSNIQLSGFNVFTNVMLLNSLHPGGIIVPGGWTISIEMLFYCMLPVLFKYITTLNKAIVFTLVTVIICVLYSFIFFKIFQHTEKMEYYYFTSLPNQLPLFGFGMIAFFFNYRENDKIHPYILFFVGGMIILQLTLVRFIPNHILFGLSFMLIVIIGDQISILKHKILCYLGKISYSAYFIHFAVLALLDKFHLLDFISTVTQPRAFLNFSIRFGIVLLIVIAISSITYYTVEIPTQTFGKKLIKEKHKNLKFA